MVEPFAIHVPADALDDLMARLRATRWPDGTTNDGGLSRARLEPLLEHWRTRFHWHAQEEALNAYPQFTAEIEETRIHFVHLRAPVDGATPVLLLHGWPGSFVELLRVGERLAMQHDVVIPSIPGFGFSSVPAKPGMSNRAIAKLLVALMSELGYSRFAVHGGDIGAGIASWMARDFAEHLTALHLNFIPGSYAPEGTDWSAEERDFLQRRASWLEAHGAYSHMQRTTPLTAAYALSDSPAGLAAWILEKFALWSDPASEISWDTLLTNVSIYWFTNTIGSSMRYYLESASTPLTIAAGERIAVPASIAHFPHEMPFPPRSFVERGFHVVRWTEMPRGGHFAALEAPELLAQDIAETLAAASVSRD